MKLTNIRMVGRYERPDGTEVNVYKGRNLARGTDIRYFLYRNKRIIINDADFTRWTKVI